ncbi:MAG: type I secretion system permease/ATPase [Deltaproteobacteria bacterium]|nr:type I secretion system permease/ATPase [Deltaproteobacteria bacterium]
MIFILRKCFKYFIFAGLFSLFINTLYLTFPLYMLAVYDRVLKSYSFSTLYITTIMALTALIILGTLDFIRSRLLVKAGVKMDELLSRKVLKEMLRDLCRADSLKYTQGLRDINILRNYFGGNSIFAFFDTPWIFIYLGIIYLIHPFLGMTATFGAIILLILGLLQSGLTKKDLETANLLNIQSKNLILKSFRAAEIIQSMGMLKNISAHWSEINDQELICQDRAGNKSQMLSATSQSFGSLMQVIIYGAGAALVLMNKSDAGVIIAASIIMGRALAPVNQAIGAWKQTSGAQAAYKRLKDLLEASSKDDQIQVKDLLGDLQVQNVGLNIGENRILNNINFNLLHGDTMGLIGPNGAGKTSLCRIILGMWAPSEGNVLLDYEDVFNIDQDSLGPQIGYLPQAVELFTGTVTENIARMGKVDSEKVIEAAKKAGAHETILRFSSGYETDIGEAGQSLSGGQRQRVGLARALYGNLALVILDEPNSNLDEEGEKSLIQAIENLKNNGTTTIMITHKLSLLNNVDKILVLKNGEMSMFGNRDDVLERLKAEG